MVKITWKSTWMKCWTFRRKVPDCFPESFGILIYPFLTHNIPAEATSSILVVSTLV